MSDPADLSVVLRRAAKGLFPATDGGWERAALWRRGVEAVVAMTGHAYLAVGEDLDDVELEALGVDGYGGAHDPRVAERIRGSGWVETLDVLLVRDGSTPPIDRDAATLVERPDLSDHPRVAVARRVRTGIQVLGLPRRRDRSVVTVAQGIGGLPELGIEAEFERFGLALLAAGVHWAAAAAGPDAPVLAAVAPGNARSVRLFLRAGFVPVGSVQLFRPERLPWSGRPAPSDGLTQSP